MRGFPLQEPEAAEAARDALEDEGRAKHTPGPWRVHSGAKGYGYVRDDQHRPICAFGSAELSSDESAANARLIAAAPGLLAAIMNSDNAHWTPAMRAAMRKAVGDTDQ